MTRIFEKYETDIRLPQQIVLGIQHTFTMFGATVLVPILTGMNISVALFMAGVSTLIFHLITRGKVPAFMGSSFAFIPPTLAIAAAPGLGLEYAQGGIFVAGVIYLAFGLVIHFFGVEKIMKFFPPIVTGPIIMVIGLKLAPTAMGMAKENIMLAVVSFAIVCFVSLFLKGFFQLLPVLFGLIGGYIFALVTGNVDFSPVQSAGLFGVPAFTVAKFNWQAIAIVAPVAIVTIVEHIGDVCAIGETCDKNFVKDPGLNRTIFGDGLAICVSSMFGGPAATTYSENTGVLALTKQFNPQIMRIAAVFAICMGVMPKFGALISTIPNATIGGISIVLFGMIASIGARTMIENKVDLTKSRNLIISAVILVLGIGGDSMAYAALAGIILNKIFPEKL